jgi:NAD(P)-dependent dehydrogenase (short-subunit alcohol dehydrogenase family)
VSLCAGRIVIITGAGRGLGRAHALELARQGASVVVNDLGAALDGRGTSSGPATEVEQEILSGGGQAVVNGEDVSEWEGARRLVAAAYDVFGGLDAVVNNAGIVRDRMFVNATEDEWEAVTRVHLKGHFAVARWAAASWRDRAKEGEAIDARIINTTSGAGLLGSLGQSVYSAAKAGIAGLTLVQAAELARDGVTANAIAPAARTRMTQEVFAATMGRPEDDGAFDAMAPENVSPLVAWLASGESSAVTGRVFEVEGGRVSLAEGWRHGPAEEQPRRWEAAELGPVVQRLMKQAPEPAPVYGTAR